MRYKTGILSIPVILVKRLGNAAKATYFGQGVALAVLSTLLLTIGLFLPRLISSQADPVQISFLRYVGGVILLSAVALFRSNAVPLSNIRWGDSTQLWHLLRAVIGFGTMALTIVASRLLPIGNVQAILACNGLLVLIWLTLRRQEPVSLAVVMGTIICIAGAVLACNFVIGSGSINGYLAALGGCVCWAVEIIIFRHVAVRSSGRTSLMLINKIGVGMLAIPALVRWQPVTAAEFAVLLSIGVLIVAAQASLILALRLVPLSITIPLRYLNVPIAMFLGFCFLQEKPSPYALLGAALVMIGGSLLTRRVTSTLGSGPR